jgi:hypothetical protein
MATTDGFQFDLLADLQRQFAACLSERSQTLRLVGKLRGHYITAGEIEQAKLEIAIEDHQARVREIEQQCDDIQRNIDEIKNRSGAKSQDDESRSLPPNDAYTYDAYLSYVTADPDLTWVWEELVPHIEEHRLRYATSEEVTPPGVSRVLGVEQALKESRRVVIVLTPLYMAAKAVQFDNILAQVESWNQGLFRLLPILRQSIDAENPPAWLPTRLNPNFVRPIDLSPAAIARGQRLPRLDPWAKLVETLRSPLPRL